MLKIRLSRTGKTSQPSFRIVLQEHARAVKGKFIEILGHYRPADIPKVLEINEERIKHWLSVGARPSDSMAVLLKGLGFENMDQFIGPRDKKRKKKKETEKEAPKVPETPKAGEKPVDEKAQEPPKTEEVPEAPPAEPAPKEEKKPAEKEAPEAPPAEEPAPAETASEAEKTEAPEAPKEEKAEQGQPEQKPE